MKCRRPMNHRLQHFTHIFPWLPMPITAFGVLFSTGFTSSSIDWCVAILLLTPMCPIWSYIAHEGPSLVRRPLLAYPFFAANLVVPICLSAYLMPKGADVPMLQITFYAATSFLICGLASVVVIELVHRRT